MKISFVVSHNYLSENGVAIVSKYLAEGFAKMGHDVTVLTNGDKRSDFYKNQVRIIRYNIRYDRLKRTTGEVNEFKHFILNQKNDVTIFECLQTPLVDIIMPFLSELYGLKILHTHDFSGLYLRPFQWRGSFYHTLGNTFNYLYWKYYYTCIVPRYINDFDGVVSLTELNKDVEYLQKIYSNKHFILANAADDSFFEYNQGKCSKDKYLVSIANYSEIKNQCGILRQYYKSNASTEYAMVFVGSLANKYYMKLKKTNVRLSHKYGKRDVEFLYGVERERIPEIVANATLYICASQWEAYSISLIEAMAVGTPFVSVDTGNARELPGGITVKSERFLHQAIDSLVNNAHEINRIRELGRCYAMKNNRQEQAVNRFMDYIRVLSIPTYCDEP